MPKRSCASRCAAWRCPRCVALATPALVVPTRASTVVKNPMKLAASASEAVSRAARDALGVDDIDETASLSDLGMDSLAGAEFVADLSRRLERAVAPRRCSSSATPSILL